MILSPNGAPLPPSEAVRRLKEVDERLDLRFVNSAAGAYWAIVERWPQGDERWSRVQTGEIQEHQAFDVRAMLPGDCSAEQAIGFVERNFVPVKDAAKDAAEHVAKVQKHNVDAKAKHVENFLIEQEDKHVRTTKHDLAVQLGRETAHPMTSGVGDGSLKGTGKQKKAAAK